MSAEAARPWWQDGVIYQIYPRSFADSNGDGIGDLRGLIAHLDHLNDGTERSLGIDGIWLSPIYPSPMHDFGYDVSDYCAISPEFGTMDDFQELLTEAHRRGIHIIMDLVLSHTSHEHPWFVEARASRDNPKRDWYLWHDGPEGTYPNNWMASFGGRAWEWDARTEQYYMHSFLAEQPDVNWRNPEVQAAMWDVFRFWLDLGVDGFRLDVANWYLKDAEFRDNPTKPFGRRAYDRQHHVYDRNRPETIEIMKEIRRVVDAYPARMTVGEVWQEPGGEPTLPVAYCADGEGLHQAFNFAFPFGKWDAAAFARTVEQWEHALGETVWPNYTLSNHDIPRAYTRFEVAGEADARARVAAAMLLTLRGTPFLYYGEEIGMRNGRITKAQLQDPLGKQYWPAPVGRDGERTPMQWSAAPQGDFTTGTPWLPVNADYPTCNVARQSDDPASLLQWYRTLIHLRKREPALHRGAYRQIETGSPALFCYERTWEAERAIVCLNFDRHPQTYALPAGGAQWRVLASVSRAPDSMLERGPVTLGAYDVLVAKASASPVAG